MQVLLECVGVVEAFNETVDYAGLLVGEIYQAVEVAAAAAHCHKLVDAGPDFAHRESGLLEGVDVAVDAAVGGVKLLCQVVHRVDGVACHELHEPQCPFNLGLFHYLHQRSSQSK